MIRNTKSSRRSWIIVKPPVEGSRHTLLLIAVAGFSVIPLLTLPILFRAMVTIQLSKPFILHFGDLAFPLCVSAFGLLPAISVGLLDRHSDRVLGYDSTHDEVVFAERWFGRVISQRRYARSDVERIQVHWQTTFTGGKTCVGSGIGWWMAQMVLASGRAVHLHGIRGGSGSPPGKWLSRFSRASELIGKPLQVSSLPTGLEEVHIGHPIQRLVGRVRQQRVRTRLVVLLVMLLFSLLILLIYIGTLVSGKSERTFGKIGADPSCQEVSRLSLTSTAVSYTMEGLCTITEGLPIGTNLGLSFLETAETLGEDEIAVFGTGFKVRELQAADLALPRAVGGELYRSSKRPAVLQGQRLSPQVW